MHSFPSNVYSPTVVQEPYYTTHAHCMLHPHISREGASNDVKVLRAFSATPLSAQGSYGDECQACSSRVLQLSNSVEIFSRVASEREQEATSENKIFHPIIVWSEMLRSSPLAQAGIDDRAPFSSRLIWWTLPSFQWHNPVSAWLSLRVRASDYCWCPNIDCFLYMRYCCSGFLVHLEALVVWHEFQVWPCL